MLSFYKDSFQSSPLTFLHFISIFSYSFRLSDFMVEVLLQQWRTSASLPSSQLRTPAWLPSSPAEVGALLGPHGALPGVRALATQPPHHPLQGLLLEDQHQEHSHSLEEEVSRRKDVSYREHGEDVEDEPEDKGVFVAVSVGHQVGEKLTQPGNAWEIRSRLITNVEIWMKRENGSFYSERTPDWVSGQVLQISRAFIDARTN